MKNPIPEDTNINNINNLNNTTGINMNKITNENQTDIAVIYQHNIQDSIIFPMNSNQLNNKNNKKEKEEENDTMVTQVPFIKEIDKKDPIEELNKSSEKTDDSSKNSSKGEEDKKEPNKNNESFYQKTKRWAGNVWSYVNIANYFPKPEFKEYRNANGDWVKIPVKKIPLKKKKVEETEEEHIINKTYDRDKGDLTNITGDRITIPNLY